jgi:hypothetical protein
MIDEKPGQRLMMVSGEAHSTRWGGFQLRGATERDEPGTFIFEWCY